MTAEVVIANHQGIALAADSAVTIGRERVWKHANKIFSLGPVNDIGVMIFNSGDFLGIPWEIIVKEHKNLLGSRVFTTVDEYADNLINFLKNDLKDVRSQEEQTVNLIIVDVLEDLKANIKCSSRTEFYEQLPKVLKKEIESLQKGTKINEKEEPKRQIFEKKFRSNLKDLALDVLGYKPKKEMLKSIFDLLWLHFVSKSESAFSTGLVIAGFGSHEMFPRIKTITVDGRWNGFFRCWEEDGKSQDLNSSKSEDGIIIPFAQSDMARLFMEGLYPQYMVFVRQLIKRVLAEKSDQLVSEFVRDDDEKIVEKERQRRENSSLVDKMGKEFASYRQISFVNPLMKTVNAIPKEEMAHIAKSIVELTALRRKFTSQLETVGGAVDVAVISKSDGFIWIDRKHYFNLDFNNEFQDRKKLRRSV